jgi:hypothetical protein
MVCGTFDISLTQSRYAVQEVLIFPLVLPQAGPEISHFTSPWSTPPQPLQSTIAATMRHSQGIRERVQEQTTEPPAHAQAQAHHHAKPRNVAAALSHVLMLPWRERR